MDTSIFDIHCHPSLKYSIWKKERFSQSHPPPGGIIGYCSPFGIYYDAPGAIQSHVRILVNAHYVPESGFEDSAVLAMLNRLSGLDIIEDPADSESAWNGLNASITRLQQMVDETNATLGKDTICILDKPSNLSAALAQNKIVVIQAFEGAHQLGRGLATDIYLTRLAQLKKAGFCTFALGHFFNNNLCDSSGGIPPSDYFVTGYSTPSPPFAGLSATGEAVVKYALQNELLLDLVHTTPAARQRIYQLNQELVDSKALPRLQPLAMTHTGLLDLFVKGKDFEPELIYYPASKADIDAISKSGGILGIILMNYWLNGTDNDDPHFDSIFATIDEVYKQTGSIDNIGIGTDLDGFTHVPDNVSHASKLGALTEGLKKQYGDTVAAKILYQNAWRVFAEACGAA